MTVGRSATERAVETRIVAEQTAKNVLTSCYLSAPKGACVLEQPPKKGVEVVSLDITGNRLRHILKRRDLTQEECARRINISNRHLTRLLRGDVPSLKIAFKLRVVLDTPIDDMFIISKKTRRAVSSR
jgi:DNA-binding XRE family transcriptional regulator